MNEDEALTLEALKYAASKGYGLRETKLGPFTIKSDKALAQPVAWLEPEWGEKICPEVGYEVTMTDDHPRDLCWIPLVAQRPWVSLTDDQIKEIVGPWGDTPIKGYTRELIDKIDAKLRENNNG
jgi:hypothetical protein